MGTIISFAQISRMSISRRSWLLGCLATLVGCARWQTGGNTRDKGNLLPAARMTRDTVVMEVAFVRQPALEIERDSELWLHCDEQIFPAQLRQRLADNGMRTGKLSTQLPAAIRQLLDAGSEPLEQQDQTMLGDNEFSYRDRHMHLRSGRRGKIIASQTYDQLAVLTRVEDVFRGLALSQAQCLFGMRVFAQGDSRVRLELTPEIEHGEMGHKWVGEEGTLVQQLQKDHSTFDSLRIDTLLSPGETLLLGGTPEMKGLGEHFFSETNPSGKQRRYLLVRVAQTQLDDLFDDRPTSDPLATPGI